MIAKIDKLLTGRAPFDVFQRILCWSMRILVLIYPFLVKPLRLILGLGSETVTLSVVAGLALLVIAQPAMTLTQGAWNTKQDFSVTFTDQNGTVMGQRGLRLDTSTAFNEMPDHLLKAVLATEDKRFYSHWGIDVYSTLRAFMANNSANKIVQGGSTLTQQLAKNLFLSNERSFDRKINEAFLAFWLEAQFSKNDIFKLYLDRAYMGNGIYGVAAASRIYFDKPVQNVSLREVSVLAGLLKAPAHYAPHLSQIASEQRGNRVLDNMMRAGFLTFSQARNARNQSLVISHGSRPETGPSYYLDWAFAEVKKRISERKMAQPKLSGNQILVVKTAFDPALQLKSDQTLQHLLNKHSKGSAVQQGAIVIMTPDGAVKAMTGGRDYQKNAFNRVEALRQPGSAFKPFVYASALSAGLYRPFSMVRDEPVCLDDWCPDNYTRQFSGDAPLYMALAKSLNTVAVKMSVALGNGRSDQGRLKIIEMAERFGFSHPLKNVGSLPLGSSEVSLMELTSGYAVFANGGRKAPAYTVLEITDHKGRVLYQHTNQEPRVLASGVVADLNFMLSQVNEVGTGQRASLKNIQSAGKTGTTSSYRDAWYVGYTGQLVTGIWFGNDDNTPMKSMTGGLLPAIAWHNIMTFAQKDLPSVMLAGLDKNKNLLSGFTETTAVARLDVMSGQKMGFQDVHLKQDTPLKYTKFGQHSTGSSDVTSTASLSGFQVERNQGGGFISLR